jgi:hypothetical protein
MPFRCLFHVHTRHSFDSLLSARTIVKAARQLGVQALIVTDHNTIRGSLDAQVIAAGDPPLVITAAEYQSEKGDIIGLFLHEEIHTRRASEIVQDIHAQGGLVVLPHPYKGHLLDDELLASVDIIETYNGRCSEADNQKAQVLAQRWNVAGIAGADAHCSLELQLVINEFSGDCPCDAAQFRDCLLQVSRVRETRRTPAACRPYSQIVKALKTKDLRLFLYQVKRLAEVLALGDRP